MSKPKDDHWYKAFVKKCDENIKLHFALDTANKRIKNLEANLKAAGAQSRYNKQEPVTSQDR